MVCPDGVTIEDNLSGRINTEVINTRMAVQDKGIALSLIASGWTPPEGLIEKLEISDEELRATQSHYEDVGSA